jgi:hypothetical protein
MKNPYTVLGADPSYNEAELRLAYIKAVKVAHPDHGGSARRFTQVREAWSILGDHETRAAYDRNYLMIPPERTPDVRPTPDGRLTPNPWVVTVPVVFGVNWCAERLGIPTHVFVAWVTGVAVYFGLRWA